MDLKYNVAIIEQRLMIWKLLLGGNIYESTDIGVYPKQGQHTVRWSGVYRYKVPNSGYGKHPKSIRTSSVHFKSTITDKFAQAPNGI